MGKVAANIFLANGMKSLDIEKFLIEYREKLRF